LALAGVAGLLAAGIAAWRFIDFGGLRSATPGARSLAAGSPGYRGGAAAGADVLLVTIDTLRADAVGFGGGPSDATPVLDRLASQGRVFTFAHAHNVVTLPSHTNVLTGLYPYQNGVRENTGFVLPARVPTLATMLSGAGYQTAAFVAAFPLDSRFGLDRGFSVYDDSYPLGSHPDRFEMVQRRGDQVVGPARAWWAAHAGGKRFLWVHLYDPHAPYQPPAPFAERYPGHPYQGEVAAADSFLAPLLEPFLAAKERPARPTIIVVTSDHGESLGEHGELTHGLFAYEATLHVPLVLWGSGVAPGRDDRSARHVDLVPTILGLLGLPVPAGLPGRSLLEPEAAGGSYFEALSTSLNRGWAPLRGVLRDRQKWISLPLPELYDLSRDAKEEKNLYSDERRVARELERALPAESVWPPVRTEQASAEELAQLKSLGYVAGSAASKTSYTVDDDPKRLIEIDGKLQTIVEDYGRGDYESAVRLSREVIAARPTMSEPYEHLALALRQLERPGEAIEALQAALARGVEREALRRQLALALTENGRGAEAVAALAPLSKSEDPATQNALGLAYAEAGRFDDAVAALERARRAAPDDPKTFENLGIVRLRMGRPAEAKALLERALAVNDQLPVSWNTLGVVRYQLRDPAGALAAWQKAVALDPRQYDALFNLGLVAAETGRRDEAREALRRFLATAPPQRFGPDLEKARGWLAQVGG
jgi:arylsulfatase A-like enzyme/Tfp pilus assembly protein PilF